ncbi:MAG: hypothetical protein WB810_09600 [Candidatus Cybelea sp.]
MDLLVAITEINLVARAHSALCCSVSVAVARMPTVLMMALAYTSLMGDCMKRFERRLTVAHTELGEGKAKLMSERYPAGISDNE